MNDKGTPLDDNSPYAVAVADLKLMTVVTKGGDTLPIVCVMLEDDEEITDVIDLYKDESILQIIYGPAPNGKYVLCERCTPITDH